MPGPGELLVAPNPVPEGGALSVDYQGEGPLYYSVDNGPWQEVPLDSSGAAQLPVAPGSAVIVVSTNRDQGTEAIVPVFTVF